MIPQEKPRWEPPGRAEDAQGLLLGTRLEIARDSRPQVVYNAMINLHRARVRASIVSVFDLVAATDRLDATGRSNVFAESASLAIVRQFEAHVFADPQRQWDREHLTVQALLKIKEDTGVA